MIKKQKFRQKNRLRLHEDTVIGLYSPGGVSGVNLYSCSKDGFSRVLDFTDKKIANTVTMLKTGPQIEEKQFDMFNDQGDIKKIAFDTFDKKPQTEFLNCVLFTENSMFGGYEDGDLYCWNIKTGEVVYALTEHKKGITRLAMLNARVLLSASTDQTIRCWDTTQGTCETVLKFDGSIGHIYVYNKVLYVLISNNQIGMFEAEKLQHIKTFHLGNRIITTFIVHNNQLLLATSENNIEIMEIQEDKCEPKGILKGHKDWILCMKIYQDYLFSGSDDRSLKVWALTEQKLVDEFTDHEDGVSCVEFCDNNIYTGSFDHFIRHYSIDEMNERIWDRKMMMKEELMSRQYEKYYNMLFKKKKKGKKGKKGKKKK